MQCILAVFVLIDDGVLRLCLQLGDVLESPYKPPISGVFIEFFVVIRSGSVSRELRMSAVQRLLKGSGSQ